MGIEISGVIVEIGETQTVGSKGFQKRAFVVKTDEKFPQDLEIEATKDRIETLDSFRVGDQVNVSANLKGRRWEGPKGIRYFISIEAWKIDPVGERRPRNETAPKPVIDVPQSSGGSDDLPF